MYQCKRTVIAVTDPQVTRCYLDCYWFLILNLSQSLKLYMERYVASTSTTDIYLAHLICVLLYEYIVQLFKNQILILIFFSSFICYGRVLYVFVIRSTLVFFSLFLIQSSLWSLSGNMFVVLLISSPSVIWSIPCCGTPVHNDFLATRVFSVGTRNEHSHISWRY